MPVFTRSSRARVRPNRELVRTYSSARKGLNRFLLDSELDQEEVREMTNMRLVGKGIIEPRGGTGFYTQADTSTVRHITDFYLNGTLELLAITDTGYLTKQSGTSYTRINGTSFASGSRPQSVQIYGKRYFVDGAHPLARYDGTTLLSYTTLTSPLSLLATKSSGTTGSFTWSWRVSAESDVGETLASDPVTLAQLPENLTTTNYVQVSWTNASPTSLVRGYVIYGREQGAQSYMSRVPSNVTTWIDDGTTDPSLLVYTPDSNTTGGPIAKYIARYKEKLLLGNVSYDNSLLMWSGSGPYIDNFHYGTGGGYYSIEKNNEDRFGITGLSEREGKFIAFKGFSIFQGQLTFNSSLGINEATVTKLVDGVGCISGSTIQTVENSVMFVALVAGRGLALAKLDYEPNILSAVLRFQPISARIQELVDAVNMARVEDMWAVYYDKKYHWFLPIGASSWTCLVYDVERLAFVGPWTLSDGWSGTVFLDADNDPHLLIGKSDGEIVELSDQFYNDEGTSFTKVYVGKKDDYGRPFQMKTVVDGWAKLRNISNGTANVQFLVEDKEGRQDVAKQRTFSSADTFVLAGWGSRRFGYNARYGYMPSTGEAASSDQVRYVLINRANSLSSQVKITSNDDARYQIIATQVRARETSLNNVPGVWRSSS